MWRVCQRTAARARTIRHVTSAPETSNAGVILHHEWLGRNHSNHNNPDTIVFLHGLLGNGKNLRTMANKVVAARQCQGLVLDLRGHGRSPSGIGPHTFPACVQDVHTTLTKLFQDTDDMSRVQAVVGHSWGGRIALEYIHSLLSTTITSSSTSLPQTWLLDTVPGQAHDSVQQVIAAVSAISPEELVDRKHVTLRLLEQGVDPSITQWLVSSLQYPPKNNDTMEQTVKDGQRKLLQWGFDVSVARDILPEFERQDFMGMVRDITHGGGTLHLVRGGKNQGWEENPIVLQELQAMSNDSDTNFHFHTLANAGHWVHVDDLPGLLHLFETNP